MRLIQLSINYIYTLSYRVLIKYCVFSLQFCDFSELFKICCSAGVLPLPGECTHTNTEGKQRKARVGNILKSSEKIQYLMDTLYVKKTIFKVFCPLRPQQNCLKRVPSG